METYVLDTDGQWVLCEPYHYNGTAWESLQFNEYARLDEVWDTEAPTISGTPPTITLHPESRSVLAGGNVTFTAACNGSSPITWTWHKNGGSAIAGAGGTGSTTSYTISSATTADAGTYVAKASNAFTGSPVSSNSATLTVSTAVGDGLAYVGADGLVLLGAPGAYAETAHAAGIQPLTGLDVIVIATSDDWSAYWGNNGGNVQALIGKAYGGALNLRCWDLVINSTGQLIGNLSTNGTAWASLVTTGLTLTNSSTYAFRLTWNKTGGVTRLFAAELTSVNDTYPASWAVGLETGDTPVATATRLSGSNLYATTANLQIGCTDLDGVSAPFKGTIHYAEVRSAVGGSPVWSCDFRNVTVGDTEFPDDTGARTITVHTPGTSGLVPVGMPNGETANVGPTASVLGHTGIAYSALDAQVDALVVTTAEANAFATTETTSDGTLRRVVSLLNVKHSVHVTSTTPVLIRDSKIGQLIGAAGSDVWIEWSDIGRGFARSGDETWSDPDLIWDGTVDVNPTTASINGATTIGSGGDTITVGSDGFFTNAGLKCQGATKITAYRCNIWGNEDVGFTAVGSELIIRQCWGHDYFWVPRDASRKTKNPPNTHYDIVKCNAGDRLELDGCRFDQWPIVPADYAALTGPAWKGPHWGKNPNNMATWPAVRDNTVGADTRHIGTAGVISNQVQGSMKNILVTDCIITGPINSFFEFGNNGAGTTWQQDITIRRNRFYSGVTATTPTPWSNPAVGVLRPTGAGLTTGDGWNWPITGPDVNYMEDVAITAHPRSNMNDSATWTPT